MKRDLSKLKIPMTPKERQRKKRAELKKSGGRELSVFLDAETVWMFDELLDRLPRLNKKRLVSAAIRHLYDDLNVDVHGDKALRLASEINK